MNGTSEPRSVVRRLPALLAVALCSNASHGCRKPAAPARPAAESAVPTPRLRTPPLDPAVVSGHWQWFHQEDREGVRRVENERWELSLHQDTVRGHYDRVVTFLSLDGVPFECSQALTYRLTTRYQLLGTADSRHFRLAEVGYSVEPSPCEGGFRRTADYRVAIADGNLVLEWEGGRQTLTRAASAPKRSPRRPSVAGAWRWQNRWVTPDENVRVESEEWEMNETAGGAITGTYLRTVTVFDPQGTVLPCNGDTYYQFRDRYSVRGTRKGTQLFLSEVEFEAADNPCLVHRERHLDAATGTVGDGFITLEWRGRFRQVLHRPGPTQRDD